MGVKWSMDLKTWIIKDRNVWTLRLLAILTKPTPNVSLDRRNMFEK